MSSRIQKRIRDSSHEHDLIISDSNEIQSLKLRSDEELFVIDKIGSKSKRRKINSEEFGQTNSKPLIVSKVERILIKKTLNNRKQIFTPDDTSQPSNGAISDIWENDDEIGNGSKGKISKNKKEKIQIDLLVHPGQSYNPSILDHQDILAEAVALEIKKKEADLKNISIETVTINRDIETYSVNDEEASDDDNSTTKIRRSKKEKLTRAQRNKIRGKKEKNFKLQKEEVEKSILHSIDVLPQILTTIDQKDGKIEQQRKMRQVQKKLKEQKEKTAVYMTYQEAASVPLTDELTGSVRTLRPKGMILRDTAHKMKTLGIVGESLSDKRMRKRKGDKPHSERNIKWHAKYKI